MLREVALDDGKLTLVCIPGKVNKIEVSLRDIGTSDWGEAVVIFERKVAMPLASFRISLKWGDATKVEQLLRIRSDQEGRTSFILWNDVGQAIVCLTEEEKKSLDTAAGQ